MVISRKIVLLGDHYQQSLTTFSGYIRRIRNYNDRNIELKFASESVLFARFSAATVTGLLHVQHHKHPSSLQLLKQNFPSQSCSIYFVFPLLIYNSSIPFPNFSIYSFFLSNIINHFSSALLDLHRISFQLKLMNGLSNLYFLMLTSVVIMIHICHRILNQYVCNFKYRKLSKFFCYSAIEVSRSFTVLLVTFRNFHSTDRVITLYGTIN